jgi:hypothetical protein
MVFKKWEVRIEEIHNNKNPPVFFVQDQTGAALRVDQRVPESRFTSRVDRVSGP